MLAILHFLHIASGIVWAGGALFFVLVVEPTLFRLGPGATRDTLRAAQPFLGRLMGASGLILLTTGGALPAASGAITSPGDLLRPYSVYVLAALALVVGLAAQSGRYRAVMQRMLSATAEVTPAMHAARQRQAVVTVAAISATIVIMAILGMGLY
ncbi:MAG: hypothetical protein BroJett030_29140 [Alphaproteobacteria bacterium]|nr:MAG: hypothetical protein BroJett030_29140 [Alphaproteobacteria bacterium]